MINSNSIFIEAVVFSALFIVARIAPIWKQRHRGCDAYFFMLCAEELRKSRRLPVVLPRLYLLDIREQWYPPGFMVFLSLIPPRILQNYYWLLNHSLDLVVALAGFTLTYHYAGPWGAWLFGLLYACESSLIIEYQNLTSRPLSTLLLFAFLGTALLGTAGQPIWLGASLLLGIMLFYTHKMAMQLLWFTLPLLSITTGDWAWAGLLVGTYIAAFAINPALFTKIVRAHWDIVFFFYRRWPWLNAHCIKNSPVYGEKAPSGFFAGILQNSWLSFLKDKLAAGYFVIIIIAALPFSAGNGHTPIIIFIFGGMAWALLTLLVPWLRCLGEGSKYLKYVLPLTLCLTAIYTIESPWLWFLMAPLLFRQVKNYWLTFKSLSDTMNKTGTMDSGLRTILPHLKKNPGNVMCIPFHLADLVAYQARTPVLWGCHGYGFNDNIDPIYPVLRKSIEQCAKDYELQYLLLDTNFTTREELHLTDWKPYLRSGSMELFLIKDQPTSREREITCD